MTEQQQLNEAFDQHTTVHRRTSNMHDTINVQHEDTDAL